MDLSDLLIFKTVVESGGIVKAAGRLHRVQSNVTTRIKQLEASIGVPLFVREKQRLHLSPQGQMLLAYADRLLRLAEEAKGAVSTGAPRGTLRLGALESTSASRLPAILSAFHARHPDVRIELRTGTNDALAAAVVDRQLDAAFIALPPEHAELSSLPLFREHLALVTALAHKPIRRAADVAGESVIAFPHGCAYRRVVERWLGPQTLASVRMMELSSYHAIVACVAAGTGVAIVPESVLGTVNSAQVARHELPKVLANVTTPLVWRTGEETPALMALREVARTEARTTKGEKRGGREGAAQGATLASPFGTKDVRARSRLAA
jgi:DNA-binding transcriptional LysR family regulator